jgi:ubiquitin carboxyl-terminal hydrolase 36/42
MKIVQAPPVLSLHLKRFTPFGRKISNLVDFKDTLTLQNPVFEGPPIEYELYGVTLHYGSGPNNGHYISIVRNESREWYQMDDSDVTRKSRLNDSDKKNTYQLHYIRRPGGKLNDILGQTSRNSVSQKPIQRPDLGRSYGASENVQPSNEPGTSEAHAKQTLMEKIRAREEASQASSRGLKRTRDDDSNDVGVPFVDPRRDQKKSKPTFAPMRGETFYANPKGKEKVASEDPDATDNEDAGEPIERDSPEKSGSGGGWDGAYDPDRQKAQISKPSFGFDSIGRGPQGSPGKRGRRRQAQSGRGKESPFMHSRNSNPNQKKFKGHAAMQPKHR